MLSYISCMYGSKTGVVCTFCCPASLLTDELREEKMGEDFLLHSGAKPPSNCVLCLAEEFSQYLLQIEIWCFL